MLEFMKEKGDKEGIADALNNMGMLMGSVERHQQALENYQQSLKIYREIDEPDGILTALGNIGIEYAEMNQYVQAEKYYRQALPLSQQQKNTTAEINTLLNLGNTLNNQGKLKEALDYFHQGLDLASKFNDPDQIWSMHLGIGDNYERQEKYEIALDHYEKALEILEGMRGSLQTTQYKTSFFADKRYIYESIVHLLCILHQQDPVKGYDKRAFQYAERAKARVFLDLMTESLQSVRSGVDQSLLSQQEKILTDLAQLEKNLHNVLSQDGIGKDSVALIREQIKKSEQAYDNIQRELRENNPKYANLTYPQPLNLEEVQSLIPDDHTVILNYFTGDISSALWAIKKDTYKLIILPEENVLKDKIELLRFALSDPSVNETSPFTMCSFNLYNDLIYPVHDSIKKDDELIIIPDGILHYLPFEILYSEPVDPEEVVLWDEMPYLVLENPISYSPSASIWAGIVQERENQSPVYSARLLAFGDPVFTNKDRQEIYSDSDSTQSSIVIGGQTLERLIYSGEEVKNIAVLFKDQKYDIYLRRLASEFNVKLKVSNGYRYIHFATHGLINERQPDFSALVFSRNENSGEDGLLYAAEIFNLKFETDLVVLSACQTGLGKMIRGEGMIGLSRAFMYAGAPTVLASLWRVSDQSTSLLMKEFYKNLIKEEMNKSDALRRAQIEMIEDEQFAHPFYWAPFVLIGDYH
jgi:CHAT domain-containing protein